MFQGNLPTYLTCPTPNELPAVVCPTINIPSAETHNYSLHTFLQHRSKEQERQKYYHDKPAKPLPDPQLNNQIYVQKKAKPTLEKSKPSWKSHIICSGDRRRFRTTAKHSPHLPASLCPTQGHSQDPTRNKGKSSHTSVTPSAESNTNTPNTFSTLQTPELHREVSKCQEKGAKHLPHPSPLKPCAYIPKC